MADQSQEEKTIIVQQAPPLIISIFAGGNLPFNLHLSWEIDWG